MDAPWPVVRRLGWVRTSELGLGAIFVAAGLVKAAGIPFMVELFASLGFGQWLRYVTALVELTGGALLLSGRLQYLAALALAVIMVGRDRREHRGFRSLADSAVAHADRAARGRMDAAPFR